MKQLNSHLFERTYKELGINLDTLGCVMLDVEPLNNMNANDHEGMEGLYYTKNTERKWINGWIAGNVAHVTLLYGLLDNAHHWEKHIESVLSDWKLQEIEIENISFFESPYEDEPYYCIVAHIKVTDELMEGHQRLEFLPHINTFNGYKPHMTICYIKKDDKLRNKYISQFNKLWSGKKLKVKENINLGYSPK